MQPAYAPTQTAPTKTLSRRPTSWLVRWVLWLLVFGLFALAIGYLALRHLVWPRLDDWRPRIVAELSARLGPPVEIARIETGFEGLLPRLTLEGLTVRDDDGEYALVVPRATLVLSPRTLVSSEPRFAVVQLESPRVRVERRVQGWLRVAGVDFDLNATDDGQGLNRLLNQRRILIRAGRVEWNDRIEDSREVLESVDLTVGTVGRRHRGSLTAGPLPGAWQRLHLATEFYRPPRSSASEAASWSGEAYVGVDQASVALLRRLPLDKPEHRPMLHPLAIESVRADLKGWLRFDRGQALDGQLKLAAADLRWRVAPGPRGLLALPEVSLDARVRRSGEQHDVLLQSVRLREAGGLDLVGDGPLRLSVDRAGQPLSVQGAVRGFDTGSLIALLQRLPLAPETLQSLREWQVGGRIASLSGRWARQAPGGHPPLEGAQGEYEAVASFERLSVRNLARSAPQAPGEGNGRPVIGLPWFQNLSGEARIGHQGGELRIKARKSVIGLPGIFAEPAVSFDDLEGVVRFALTPDPERIQVTAEIDSIRFGNSDASGVVSGQYRSGGKGPGLIAIEGRLDRGEGTRVWRYLPMVISQPVRDWVQHAVVSGKLDDVKFLVRGDLADFPFARPGEGEFVVDSHLSDATLVYAPGWPRIERGEGRLRLERNGLQVAMRSGQVFDVALSATTATIRDYAEAVVRVEGSGEGAAQEMIRFVNDSPVATRIDDFVRDTVIQGNARLQLRLELPLHELERSRVAGSVGFTGNRLTLDSTLPPFANLTGTLEFSELGLALRGMAATFLGGPLRVEGETTEPGRLALRAQGRIDAAGMRGVVDNPLTRRLTGETDYKVSIDVSRRAASLTLESDLTGLAASLPAPFTKAADARWPLKVQTTAQLPSDPNARSMRDTIRIELRDSVRLALERERDPTTERLLIRRGAFAIDGPTVLPEQGLSLLLNTADIDLDAWMPLLMGGEMRDVQQRAATEFAPGFSLLPSTVAVVSPLVTVGGKRLHDVVFGATRVEGFWRANIGAREVNGFFNWREPAPGQRIGTLTARFTRLEIPKARASEFESLLDTSPDELPALDIAAEELVLGDRRLGAMSLKATNGGTPALPVWRLDELKVDNPAATLSARGTWAPARAGSARSTTLDFDLEVADAGALLGVYGLQDALKGGSGEVAGSLRWQGSPLAIDYPSLSGTMHLQVGKGQFLKTEPGLAKLIGVLSLQSLPRRLSLDFRDVFSEGFAFDGISADVQVEAGVARTDNFQMRGAQAQVDIRGVASLANETQSLEVAVRPEFNAGLASLAYAALANPVIGLGTFVAQFVLRRPLQQLLSYEYAVSGSWADPLVSERRRQVVTPARIVE
ncbi:MAG: TIGR02099 family protein [Burkholderiaceae bacterium]|nr:TIGR02099 family protein [Burkholderiaceae bacterium]